MMALKIQTQNEHGAVTTADATGATFERLVADYEQLGYKQDMDTTQPDRGARIWRGDWRSGGMCKSVMIYESGAK